MKWMEVVELEMEGPGDAGRSTVIGDLSRRLLCAAQGSPSAAAMIRDLAPRLVESGTPAVQQLAAGTASFAFMGYPSHATPLMAKRAPVQWETIEGPELTRGVWVGAAKGPHPNAARLFVHFFTSDEGQQLYCKASDGSKTAIDRSGKRTGCQPFSEDVVFLPDTPLTREKSATVLQGTRPAIADADLRTVPMKIVSFETFQVDGGWESFSFLKLVTDEGLVGWSEYNEARGRRA